MTSLTKPSLLETLTGLMILIILVVSGFYFGGLDNPPPPPSYDVGGGVCGCLNCSDCVSALNDPLCLVVNLTANTSLGVTCIDNPANFSNKVFDCQGYTITGGVDWYGIYLNGKNNNTIKNCVINNFYNGIYLITSSNNTLMNNIANFNVLTGIYLINIANNNTLTNNTASNNSFYGIVLSNSSNNTLTNNTANNNTHQGIVLISADSNNLNLNTVKWNTLDGFWSTTSNNNTLSDNILCNNNQINGAYFDIESSLINSGDNNTCDTTSGWNDTGATGCSVFCNGYVNNNNCSTCDECEYKLSSSLYSTVSLTSNITNTGTCINYPANSSNKIFDCQGYTINGDGTGYGVLIDYKINNQTIKNCVINNFSEGIYGEFDDSNIFKFYNNTITNTGTGIHIWCASYPRASGEIINNTINSSSVDGINIYQVWLSKIENNKIYNTVRYGIYFDDAPNNNVSNNTLINNTYGMYFYIDSNSNILTGNNITSGDYGVVFHNGYVSSNTLNDNLFCSNTKDIENDGTANIGYNNTCDITNNWNDNEIYSGCRYNCSNYDKYCKCGNCTVCEHYLNQSCSTVNLTNSITVNGSCLSSSSKTNKNLNCGGYYIKGYNSSTGFNLNSVSNFNITSCNLTNFSVGLQVNNSNITLTNNVFCDNTKDVSNTSGRLTSTNTTCTYASNFSCDYFCTPLTSYNWTIWNGTGWKQYPNTSLQWTYTNMGWQQEPVHQKNYDGQCIWNITSTGACTITRIYLKQNISFTGLTFKANTQSCDHCYYSASTLSTNYTQFNVTNGGVFCLWVDSRFPKNTYNPGFNITFGGSC